MRKLLSLFLVFFITLSIIWPRGAHAAMPPKAKALLTMAGYGTASGALLGVATMAFGYSTRAVAQGASLGLYAGLIFGTYVILSHNQKRAGTYNDSNSPYLESKDVYGDEYNSEEGGDTESSNKNGGFFDRFEMMKEQFHAQAFTFQSEKRRGGSPSIQMNLFRYEF